MNILIVEDNRDKLQKITSALKCIEQIDTENIVNVVDAHNAKKELREKNFDLLILDIAIPMRVEQEVQQDGGIRLLEELTSRIDFYKLPVHIIGITMYEDVYDKAKENFKLFALIFSDLTSDNWVNQLKTKVRYIISAKNAQDGSTNSYNSFLAIVCALDSPELDKTITNGWDWKQFNIPNDATEYHITKLKKNGTDNCIYAASAPKMGLTNAAILAMKMIAHFRPRYIGMAGITAGIRGKVNFGDVIVANPVWEWGCGKWCTKNGEKIFQPEPYQLDLDVTLRSKLFSMSKERIILSEIRHNWPGDKPDNELSIRIGPMASGASVLADHVTSESITEHQHRKLLGIDMEAYAIFSAAYESTTPRPTAFSLKSVVDFADLKKDDRYHNYAAYTSAQVLKLFVEKYL